MSENKGNVIMSLRDEDYPSTMATDLLEKTIKLGELEAALAEAKKWILETADDLKCRCDKAYTLRGRHGPDCMAYLLLDMPKFDDETKEG